MTHRFRFIHEHQVAEMIEDLDGTLNVIRSFDAGEDAVGIPTRSSS
jgi:hypothetical protein